MPTEYGEFRLFAYQDSIDSELHLALVLGEIDPREPVLVRVHVQSSLCDLFSTTHDMCGWPLKNAMRQVSEEGGGVIVVLRNHDSTLEIMQRMRALCSKDKEDSVLPGYLPVAGDRRKNLRTYGIGAQILSDLEVHKMRVLSAPKSMHGISGFDLEVVEYVECR